MIKKITNYQEMLDEEERLRQLLQVQQQQVQADMRGIREEIQPIVNIAGTAKKFFVRKGGQAAAMAGIKLVVDGLVKNMILRKAGWITRFVVPFLLKNYASHIADDPKKFLHKIKHLFGKNGKVATPE